MRRKAYLVKRTIELCSFFKNWPLLCLSSYFPPSTLHNSNINWWKLRWCAWDSNPGLQNGRSRRIHRAMAAPYRAVQLPRAWSPFEGDEGMCLPKRWAVVFKTIPQKLFSMFYYWADPVVNLIKHFTIIVYNSRVVLTTNFPILWLKSCNLRSLNVYKIGHSCSSLSTKELHA